MKQPHYAITVVWSDEDGGWVADAPDLKSCSAFGATPEGAVADQGHDRAARRGELAADHGDAVLPLAIAVLIVVRLMMPIVRTRQQLLGANLPSEEEVTRVRRHALRLPSWTVALAFFGWVPGGLLFPVLINWFSPPLDWHVYAHFLTSFTISGLIAMTYSLFAIQFLVLRVLYPRLWIDARNLRHDSREELGPLDVRLTTFQVLAGLIPLAGAVMMIFGSGHSFSLTYRLLVTALVAISETTYVGVLGTTPLAAIATADFPAPQPLSVTLVPPATPLAAIAAATFPTPQPLSVTLYAGEPLQAATVLAGIAPPLTLGTGLYTAQIVQVIPRRGVNFFDRSDPTGQATVVVAQAGGGGGGAGAGASACAAGPTSGGTFQSVIAGPYPKDIECHSLAVVSDPAGQGDVLAMGDFHMIFAAPGASLSAAVNVNSGANFATLTGTNASTMSITGVTAMAQGTAPAGTQLRIDGTASALGGGSFTNYTLTVCTAAGAVVYRRPAGDCL